MRVSLQNRIRAGFTITEVAVSIALMATVFISLYAGIGSGFSVVNVARENLRANQIIVEKMETIRLYHWDQVNSNGFIPPTFTAPFFPASATTNAQGEALIQAGNEGVTYYGEVTITNAPIEQPYGTNMRLVSVTLRWTNGVERIRELETLISRDGVQNYIYY